MRYGLYYGCAIPTRLPSVERATPIVLERLGIEAAAIKEVVCCMDPIVLKSLSSRAWLAVAARNLVVAKEQGFDAILTLCNGCYCSLNEAVHLLQDGTARARVNDDLQQVGKAYAGGIEVVHLAHVLDAILCETVTGAILNPFEGRRIACFHGCHLVRPSRYAESGDPLRPRLLDRLVERLGATSVAYSERNECCGMGFVPTGERVGPERLASVLEAMEAAGVEWIVTPCPSCFMQLETAQRLAKDLRPMPVLHLAELYALAFGSKPEEIGLKVHRIPFTENPVMT